MSCAICKTRRARRHCPGIGGELCAQCCGECREVTIGCPLDCPHLLDGRVHERRTASDAGEVAHPEVEISRGFLQRNERLASYLSAVLAAASAERPYAVDSDAREALESLIRSYKTLQSGVYYESRPENSIAARLFSAVQKAVEGARAAEQRERGVSQMKDSDILGLLVFFLRLCHDCANPRPKGRAFLHLLQSHYAASYSSEGVSTGDTGSSLILA